jgi:predicted ester cyclase
MASSETTNAVLLEVLSRHLKGEPHERAEITINETIHEIVSSELDFLVRDTSSALIAARLILTLRNTSQPAGGGDVDQPNSNTSLAAHIITPTITIGGNPGPSSLSTTVILDDPSTPATRPTYRACTIPITHPPRSAGGQGPSRRAPGPPLADTYKRYIETFMTPNPETALADLPQYLQQQLVTHNTHRLTTQQYHNLLQQVRSAVPDISCEIVDLIADEERQVVAAGLEFRGTMVRPLAGAGSGGLDPHPRAITIPEVVFYWFEGGRIREVVSLVDLKGAQSPSWNA